MSAQEHVKAQNRASRKAMKRLREAHEEEYATLYTEEALQEGVMPRMERKRILIAASSNGSSPHAA